MAIKQQSLPHFGVKNGWKRNAESKVCSRSFEEMGEKKTEKREFKSIGQAKRFMRTGDPGPAPCIYKQSNAAKYITRRTNAATKLAQIRAKATKAVI